MITLLHTSSVDHYKPYGKDISVIRRKKSLPELYMQLGSDIKIERI